MNKLTVDRIEENIAVCEDTHGNIREYLLDDLPKGIAESDVILESDDGTFSILEDEKKIRKNCSFNKQKSLFMRNK